MKLYNFFATVINKIASKKFRRCGEERRSNLTIKIKPGYKDEPYNFFANVINKIASKKVPSLSGGTTSKLTIKIKRSYKDETV